MSTSHHPKVELLSMTTLTPNPRNARVHSTKQISQIAASIKRFGWLVPIVADPMDRILAGHGRWEAAKLLGLDEVPVIRAHFVTEEDRRAFAIAENRIAELSNWDEDILGEELKALFECGYELEITGFSISDLDISVPPLIEEDKPLPALPSIPVSREGDLWRSGEGRLICGDAKDVKVWEKVWVTNERS